MGYYSQNLFILLVYQRVFTFARLSPNYYYFLGRSVSPGQLILCINTGRCRVARFKPEEERELPARFIIQFRTGSPTPAQVIQNELFFRGDFAVQQLCKVPSCTEFAGALSTSPGSPGSGCQRENTNVPYLLPGNQILLQQLRSRARRGCAGKGSLLASQKADPKIMEISLLTFLLYVINLINSVNKG